MSKTAGGNNRDAKQSKRGEKRADKKRPGTITSFRSVTPAVPRELQQALLNVFTRSFHNTFGGELQGLIQTVKGHLFNRDFGKAFSAENLLEAYAVRWSPSRALAYLDLFSSLAQIRGLFKFPLPSETVQEELQALAISQPCQDPQVAAETSKHFGPTLSPGSNDGTAGPVQVTCLGAGAGPEIVALAGLLHMASCRKSHADPTNTEIVPRAEDVTTTPPSADRTAAGASVNVIDVADWSKVIQRLEMGGGNSAALSMIASSIEEGSQNLTLDLGKLEVSFTKGDLLQMPAEGLTPLLRSSRLVTLMFTLNELYTTSMAKTTNLLLTLTYIMSPAALLLVVDSPGNYSTVDIGNSSITERPTQKKYPMQWLLDHTLLDASSIGSSKHAEQKRQWEKVDMVESKWFRLPKGLRYPLDLEDMRYQYHLYRRLPGEY